MNWLFKFTIVFLEIFCISLGAAYANEDLSLKKKMSPKVYTRGSVTDYKKDDHPMTREKGAVFLVWERQEGANGYEIEIFRNDRPNSKINIHTQENYYHVMIFFDKEYSWKVRALGENKTVLSSYSEMINLAVIRRENGIKKLSETKTGKTKDGVLGAVIIPEGQQRKSKKRKVKPEDINLLVIDLPDKAIPLNQAIAKEAAARKVQKKIILQQISSGLRQPSSLEDKAAIEEAASEDVNFDY